jgi:hypothetical protein
MSTELPHLPSIEALLADDFRLLTAELGVLAARQQLAVVRAIADELESCLLRCIGEDHLRAQLAEELAQLAVKTLGTVAVLERREPRPDAVEFRSGVY